MIKTKYDLKFYLREDARRNDICYSKFLFWIKYICGSEQAHIYRWIKHYRKWEYYSNTNNMILSRYHEIVTKRLGLRLGITARINTIGYGMRIMHLAGGGGCRLGMKKAGNYCGFNAGVLIGVNGDDSKRPTLGDHVAFGPGSKAFGDITIGDNVFVAANSVVTKDCEANSIYGGIPAKKIK